MEEWVEGNRRSASVGRVVEPTRNDPGGGSLVPEQFGPCDLACPAARQPGDARASPPAPEAPGLLASAPGPVLRGARLRCAKDAGNG